MLSIDNLDLNRNKDIPQQDVTFFTLFKEQKQVLFLMNQLERQRHIVINNSVVDFNCVRLATSFSFGNSIIALCLIKIQHSTPLSRHYYINNITYSGLRGAVLLNDDLISSTLIVVEDYKCDKWVQHCRLFKMKYLVVRNKQEFLDFCVLLVSNALDEYDAVILVYKKYTTMNLPTGLEKHVRTLTSTNIVAILGINYKWRRMIIDNVVFKKTDNRIMSNITWYFSNTFSKSYSTYDRLDLSNVSTIVGKMNDINKSNYIQSLVIHSHLDKNSFQTIPRVKNMIYITVSSNNIIMNCLTKGDILTKLNKSKQDNIDTCIQEDCEKCSIPLINDEDSSTTFYITACCRIILCRYCITSRETGTLIIRCPQCSKLFTSSTLLCVTDKTKMSSLDITNNWNKYDVLNAVINKESIDVPVLLGNGLGLENSGIMEGNTVIDLPDPKRYTVIYCGAKTCLPIELKYNKNIAIVTTNNRTLNNIVNPIEVTDLIVLDQHKDKTMYHRILGQLQRFNRTFSLRIHTFVDD